MLVSGCLVVFWCWDSKNIHIAKRRTCPPHSDRPNWAVMDTGNVGGSPVSPVVAAGAAAAARAAAARATAATAPTAAASEVVAKISTSTPGSPGLGYEAAAAAPQPTDDVAGNVRSRVGPGASQSEPYAALFFFFRALWRAFFFFFFFS